MNYVSEKTSQWLIRLGLRVQLFQFRRELTRSLDNGTVELWGTQLGLDEVGCVCSEDACFFKRYHAESLGSGPDED